MLFLAANEPMISPSLTCYIFQVSTSRLSPLLPLQVWEEVRENLLLIRRFLTVIHVMMMTVMSVMTHHHLNLEIPTEI